MFHLVETTNDIATIYRSCFHLVGPGGDSHKEVDEEVGCYFWKSDEVKVTTPLSLEELEELIRTCRGFLDSKPEKYKAFTKEWLEAFQPELAKTFD
jgi:hypothetical protein